MLSPPSFSQIPGGGGQIPSPGALGVNTPRASSSKLAWEVIRSPQAHCSSPLVKGGGERPFAWLLHLLNGGGVMNSPHLLVANLATGAATSLGKGVVIAPLTLPPNRSMVEGG